MTTVPPDPNAPITKAVIAAAGSGTRFLPATKALPKEMIPLIDRPIVQYIVEELAASGIVDVVFVTRWDKKVLEDHFDRHPTLEDTLSANGKAEYLAEVRRANELVNAAFIRQRGPYGNGTPALNAAPLVGDAPFVYAFADDLVSATVPFTQQLIDQYRKTPGVVSRRTTRCEKDQGPELRHDRNRRCDACHPHRRKARRGRGDLGPGGVRPLHPAARDRRHPWPTRPPGRATSYG